MLGYILNCVSYIHCSSPNFSNDKRLYIYTVYFILLPLYCVVRRTRVVAHSYSGSLYWLGER